MLIYSSTAESYMSYVCEYLRLGAAEGGTGNDDFTFRLLHASHTTLNASKRESCPYMSGPFESVGRGRLQASSAPSTMRHGLRKTQHRGRGAITIVPNMLPPRRPRGPEPRSSAPLMRAAAPLRERHAGGTNSTTSEGHELLKAPLPSRTNVSGVVTWDGG